MKAYPGALLYKEIKQWPLSFKNILGVSVAENFTPMIEPSMEAILGKLSAIVTAYT